MAFSVRCETSDDQMLLSNLKYKALNGITVKETYSTKRITRGTSRN